MTIGVDVGICTLCRVVKSGYRIRSEPGALVRLRLCDECAVLLSRLLSHQLNDEIWGLTSSGAEGAPEKRRIESLGHDEPVFVLRAQDRLAPIIVSIWRTLALMHGASREKHSSARYVEMEMLQWQISNGSKWPD